MPDARLVRRLAHQERYQIGPLEKAYRLAALLAEIARDSFLSNRLVLKGGTALHVYHGELARLSVDADLNYTGPEEAEAVPEAKRGVVDAVRRIAESQGYAPRTVLDSYALEGLMLAYRTVNGGTDAIKVDLNFLDRVPVLPPARVPPPALFRLESEPVRCLEMTELAGSKVATAVLRGAARDVYDVAVMDWATVDVSMARKIALFHGFLDHAGLVNFDPSRVDAVTQRTWDRDVQNLLRKGSEVRREDVVRQAKARVRDLLPLQAGERRCQARLLEGVWNPRLLFGEAPVDPALGRHPGMEWRLRNPDARMPR